LTLSLYEIALPTSVRMLSNLSHLLDKAKSHGGGEAEAYLEARLAPDMLPLSRQIQIASDSAVRGAARLAGVEPPSMPDTEVTIADLRARLAKAIAYLESFKPAQISDDAGRKIELSFPGRTVTFTAKEFIFNFTLPNLFFHVVTAYDILRAQGVPLGKLDYLNGAPATA